MAGRHLFIKTFESLKRGRPLKCGTLFFIRLNNFKDAPAVFVYHMKIGANTPEKGDDTDCGVQARHEQEA